MDLPQRPPADRDAGRQRITNQDVTFTLIVATAGRQTLPRALSSATPQLVPGDEIIVAFNDDGPYGDAAIVSAAKRACGGHLIFCDDDDAFVSDGITAMRTWARANPSVIGVFRRRSYTGEMQWGSPVLGRGNIQRMCLCIPNRGIANWPQFDYDWQFVAETARLQNAEVVFVDRVVGLIRPDWRDPLRRMRYKARLRSRLHATIRRQRPR